MIQLPNHIIPDENTIDRLKIYQDEIDALATFELKSKKAKDIFPTRNRIGNAVFDAIKMKLTEMCSGARRCVYCEDSVGDEVEHIRPKDLYPGSCFLWNNYVYACGNCNAPKNNKFAVFKTVDGTFHEVNPPKGTPASEPPDGLDAMINPRIENPLEYCMLDLASTFKFVIIKPVGTNDAQKAHYTFNEVLRLNEREFLRKARENAYINYKSRLGYYNSEKSKGVDQTKLNTLISNLKQEAHPTVWKEIQRQHTMDILKKIDVDLNNLLIQSPEALTW